MDDLRESYNVTKRKRKINIPNIFNIKLKVYRNIIILASIGLLIFNPSLVGSYVGTWMSEIHTSFTSNLSVTLYEWGILLGTILIFILFYKLIKWGSNK